MTKSLLYRVVPFALFMGFVGLQQGLEWMVQRGLFPLTEQQLLYLYPIKALLVGLLLVLFFRHYREFRFSDFTNLKTTLGSVLLGLLVFILWINMNWKFTTFSTGNGFDPTLVPAAGARNLLIFFRLFGAALVVPVMEELFWRSFLLRYIINSNFESIAIGAFTWSSFAIGSVLFGLEHNLILAGVMAGVAYNLLLYRTKSICQCVLAHAVTNLALGIYVLQTGNWQFW